LLIIILHDTFINQVSTVKVVYINPTLPLKNFSISNQAEHNVSIDLPTSSNSKACHLNKKCSQYNKPAISTIMFLFIFFDF
jgi:hypothetical protein